MLPGKFEETWKWLEVAGLPTQFQKPFARVVLAVALCSIVFAAYTLVAGLANKKADPDRGAIPNPPPLRGELTQEIESAQASRTCATVETVVERFNFADAVHQALAREMLLNAVSEASKRKTHYDRARVADSEQLWNRGERSAALSALVQALGCGK